MRVVKRGIMPDGVKIQIEDWSEDYTFLNPSATLAGYPIAKKTLPSKNTWSYPEVYRPFRVSFEFADSEITEKVFNDLINGKKTLQDLKEYTSRPELIDCI